MEKDLYILKWEDCDMIGIFRGSDLSLVSNSTESMFFWSLQHVMNIYNCKDITIHIIKSREELQNLRRQRGLKTKPTLDEYLKEQGFDYEHVSSRTKI